MHMGVKRGKREMLHEIVQVTSAANAQAFEEIMQRLGGLVGAKLNELADAMLCKVIRDNDSKYVN